VTDAIELSQAAAPARHLVIICALLSAAARFVPVPFVDDLLRERIRQYLVSRLLRHGGRGYGSARVGPLWQDEGSCASGCLTLLWKIPIKILLFPIRKLIALVTAIKGFSRDLTVSLLFGRALERALARGLLAEGSPEPLLLRESAEVRRAFEQACQGVDKALVTSALANALRGIRGLPGAALRSARSLARSSDAPDPEAAAKPADREKVEQGAGAVEQALTRPDVARVLAEFDTRFDAALPRG
jgi:hypothetical protein